MELIIVIGIVSVLAAILLPVISRSRQKAYEAVCISNVRQIGQALEMYLQDYDMHLPSCAWRPADNPDNLPYLHRVLSSYLRGNEKVFHCPADNNYYSQEGTSYEWNQLVNGRHYDTSPDFETYPYLKRSDVPILYDIDNFHFGRKNILYPEVRVGKVE